MSGVIVYVGYGVLMGGLLWGMVEIQLWAASDASDRRMPPVHLLAAIVALGLTAILFGVVDPRKSALTIGWPATVLAIAAVWHLMWMIAIQNLRFQMTGRIIGGGFPVGPDARANPSTDEGRQRGRWYRETSATTVGALLWIGLLLVVLARLVFLTLAVSR